MRLLTLDSSGVIGLTHDTAEKDLPPYAILSHTWGPDNEEVTFEDITSGQGKNKAGYQKILFCGQQARKDGLDHFWVDTCCINKASHSELSESIISMFRWYRNSKICYVYLRDVSSGERNHEGHGSWRQSFTASRWFTRGWTLQELLAPPTVEFFSQETTPLGSKRTLTPEIADVTKIPAVIFHGMPLSKFEVGDRLRWATGRQTKKPEDRVYSLFGILDVFMPVLYGEGLEHASIRLNDAVRGRHGQPLDDLASVFAEPSLTDPTPDPDITLSLNRDRLLSSFSYEHMVSRQDEVREAFASTGEWLLRTPKYMDWMDDEKFKEHKGFFWLKGKAGMGKSTLTKFAYVRSCESNPGEDAVVSFFFNGQGDLLERSTLGMYRSFISQLVEKATDSDLLQILGGLAPRSSQDQHFPWDIGSMQELFTAAVQNLGRQGRRLRCFIDALDECNQQEIRDMIDCFERLGPADNLYLFLASRPHPAIPSHYGVEIMLEHEAGQRKDLGRYVRGRLSIEDGKKELLEEAQEQVQRRANGSFTWAATVVDMLNNDFRRGRYFNIRRRLSEIPSNLSDLYRDILCSDLDKMDDMLLCLQLILFTRRPLTSEEFYFAMITGPSSDLPTAWNHDNLTADDMNRYVCACLKGLAEPSRGRSGHEVRFTHLSVRDFLIKDRGLVELWPELGDDLECRCHDRLRRRCQDYLMLIKDFRGLKLTPEIATMFVTNAVGQLVLRLDANDLLHMSKADIAVLRAKLTADYPFLEYATRQIFYHADKATAAVFQHDFLTDFDFSNWVIIHNLIEPNPARHYVSDATIPNLLASQNATNLREQFENYYMDWVAG